MDFKPDLKNILDQAQKMQKSMQDAQAELANMSIEGRAGAGDTEVIVTMNGRHQCQAVKIAPELIDEDDVEILEDLVRAAINDATQKIEGESQKRITSLTADLKMPEGFDMPNSEG